MNQREVILVFGQTGSGKSYLARSIARSFRRVLVADAGFGDYAPIEETRTYPDLLEKLQAYKAFDGQPFRLSYDFRPEEYELPFSTVLHLRDTLLVLEEGDRFDPALDDYREVIARGRHYGLDLLVVSLHPRAISTDLRRQATKIISFRQIFPDDLDWLAYMMGDQAYTLGDLPGPPQSPPHPYLEWTQTGGTRLVGGTANITPGSPVKSGTPQVKPLDKNTSSGVNSPRRIEKDLQ